MLKDRSCIAMVALMLCGALTVMAQGRPDDIGVAVNGELISTAELALLLPQVRSEMTIQGLDIKGDAVLRNAVMRAIDSKLLEQEARRRGIQPNVERIEEKMRTMAENAGGRAELEATLIKSRITYDQLRETAVQSDLVQSLVETEVGAGMNVTDEEVAAFDAENPDLFTNPDLIHTRHILFKVATDANPTERETARGKAVAARQRALAGEDFAALAVELSEGPNASNGGDLGFTARGQMVKAFDDAVWVLAAGEISNVVESDLGYHVIKVEEIAEGTSVSIEEARPLVTDLLRQQSTGQTLSRLVAQLRETADIRETNDQN